MNLTYNKNMKKSLFFTAILIAGLSGFAQTPEQRKQIASGYDQVAIAELNKLVKSSNEKEMAKLEILKAQNNWPQMITLENGNIAHLVGLLMDDQPRYVTTFNAQAAQMQGATSLYNGGSLGVNIEGQNMTVGVWDGDKVRDTHQSLTGRATAGELLFSLDGHATHVSGTIISDGTGNASGKGIAPQASVVYYKFRQTGHNIADEPEMIAEATNGLLVSNHSYGVPADVVSQSFLGKYDNRAQLWDQIAVNFPNYLIVSSAGNSRNDGVNFADFGYDLLTGNANAKNILTVGASVGQSNYSGPASVPMSNFSSWGPTDDGRVKPDITTKGVGMLSTDSGSNTAFVSRQGTSMSSPAVAGGAILLQQYWMQLNNGVPMKAASLKGLMLHTVNEAGANNGPDYQFGWGLLNTRFAAETIGNNGNNDLIDEKNLVNNGSYTQVINANSGKLIVSISWTDPAATQLPSNAEDDPLAMVVNDLDLTLTDSNGTVSLPWKLDPAIPSAAATNGINNVDVFEKIEIDVPSGVYTIGVTHKGSLVGGSQNFSLIVSGADQGTFSNQEDNLDTFSLYPNPANDHFTVAFNNVLSGDKVNVVVYDVLGQEVLSNSYDNNGAFEQRISTASLDSGIYLVRVGNGLTATTKKLIVR